MIQYSYAYSPVRNDSPFGSNTTIATDILVHVIYPMEYAHGFVIFSLVEAAAVLSVFVDEHRVYCPYH